MQAGANLNQGRGHLRRLHFKRTEMRLPRSACTLLCVVMAHASLAVDGPETTYAEDLVRSVYYEGMPYAAAAQVTHVGSTRLVEMLGEPGEAAAHPQVLTALGMSGHAGSYEALVAFAVQLGGGEIDRQQFRAWRALPGAMGYLARKDPRAIRWLIAELRGRGGPHP